MQELIQNKSNQSSELQILFFLPQRETQDRKEIFRKFYGTNQKRLILGFLTTTTTTTDLLSLHAILSLLSSLFSFPLGTTENSTEERFFFVV